VQFVILYDEHALLAIQTVERLPFCGAAVVCHAIFLMIHEQILKCLLLLCLKKHYKIMYLRCSKVTWVADSNKRSRFAMVCFQERVPGFLIGLISCLIIKVQLFWNEMKSRRNQKTSSTVVLGMVMLPFKYCCAS